MFSKVLSSLITNRIIAETLRLHPDAITGSVYPPYLLGGCNMALFRTVLQGEHIDTAVMLIKD